MATVIINDALLTLSLVLAIITTTTTTVVVSADDAEDIPNHKCDTGTCNDVPTAVALKKSLINDLNDKVPKEVANLYYCNTLAWKGVTMWGYGQCTRQIDNDTSYCRICLSLVGNDLIASCNDEAASGYAWDKLGACYLKVGFTSDACL